MPKHPVDFTEEGVDTGAGVGVAGTSVGVGLTGASVGVGVAGTSVGTGVGVAGTGVGVAGGVYRFEPTRAIVISSMPKLDWTF